MPESKLTKLTGQIVSIETGDYPYGNGAYWVDLALKLIEGHMIKVQLTISVSVAGGNLDDEFDYKGIGAIQIHDLSNELDRYVREKFRTTEEDYFTEREVVLISRLLTTARDLYKGDV